MKTAQFRWDVYLITNWFQHPSYKMIWVIDNFIKKQNITIDDYLQLKRVPRGFMPSHMRVEPFVGCGLKKLANTLYNSSIEDCFDIALKLKNSKIDVIENAKIAMIDKKDYADDVKDMKLGKQKIEYLNNLYDSHRLSSQWHVCK